MKDKAEQEKTCQNCKYYSQHFSKHKTRLLKVGCGHCVRKKHNKSNPTMCHNWEDNASKKQEQNKSIIEIIKGMGKRLEEISEILKDD